jgi:hypothetical protein
VSAPRSEALVGLRFCLCRHTALEHSLRGAAPETSIPCDVPGCACEEFSLALVYLDAEDLGAKPN